MSSRPERIYKVLDTCRAHKLTCESTGANRAIILRDIDTPTSLAELNALAEKYEGTNARIDSLEVLSSYLDDLASLYLELGDDSDSLVEVPIYLKNNSEHESLSETHLDNVKLVRDSSGVFEEIRDPNRVKGKLKHCHGRYTAGEDYYGKKYYRDE